MPNDNLGLNQPSVVDVLDEMAAEEAAAKFTQEKELTPEDADIIASDAELARITQVLSTGPMTSQMKSIMRLIPEDRHGFFCRERDGDLFKYVNQLGYRIETVETLKGANAVHSSGDGRIRVGDVILLTTSKKNFENIQRAEAMLVRKKLDIAPAEYKKNSGTNPLVPIIDESQRIVSKH